MKAKCKSALKLIKRDKWLEPYTEAIEGRHNYVLRRLGELTGGKGEEALGDFASGYLYFGLHRTARGWVLREWAPNATAIYLVGDFNNWTESEEYAMKRLKGNAGNWEIKLPAKTLKHGDLYKLSVHWEGGQGERIPAWVRRVVQDTNTKLFAAQVWAPEKEYQWHDHKFKAQTSPLLIYECHIGMGQDAEKVGSYE